MSGRVNVKDITSTMVKLKSTKDLMKTVMLVCVRINWVLGFHRPTFAKDLWIGSAPPRSALFKTAYKSTHCAIAEINTKSVPLSMLLSLFRYFFPMNASRMPYADKSVNHEW